MARTDHLPTARPPRRAASRALPKVAAVSLVFAGLSLAVYALTAFTTRDWTVAGPGLAVAAAGLVGLRHRWVHLAGLVPIGAILSVAGPILAFDLARPGETPYFVGTVCIVLGGCLAAVFGTASAISTATRALSVAVLASLVAAPIVFVTVIGSNPASAAPDGTLSASQRSAAVDVEMVDVAFVVDPAMLEGGRFVHIRNTGALPHDFTIEELDIAVFVPPGRDAYLRLPETMPEAVRLVCTVGDHLERGMRLGD